MTAAQRQPLRTTDGRTFATVDLWWAEVERIATERYGPRETRYKKAPPPAVITRNTWSDESADVGRAHAQEEDDRQKDGRQAQDEGSNESENEAKGDTHAGTITRDHPRDRAPGTAPAAIAAGARAARVQASTDTDPDARDGDDSRDRTHRGVVPAPSLKARPGDLVAAPTHALLKGDALPASGPHGAQADHRHDPASASGASK